MDNPLNQYEIEALLRLAHAGQTAAPERQRTVEPYRFERSGQFGAEQASVVSGVQEALAKGITQSLGAYLRTSFEATLASMEQMTFREAVEHLPPQMYLLSLQFQGGCGIIQIDQSLVFPLIDILLGGTGQGPMVSREVTEIEDHVMEGVGKIICHEIAAAWGVDAGNCDLVGAQRLPQVQRLLPANDRVVVSKFESKMGETSGELHVLIPALTFNGLLRKLSSDAGGGKAAAPSPSGAKLAQKMMDCLFPVSLALSAIQLPVEKVLELRPDQVCDLGVPLNRSASFIVAGRETFDGIPVRQGHKRAAQIGQQKKQSAQEKRGQS